MTKHIHIKHNFIRDALKKGQIGVDFVPTKNMEADILTKDLPLSINHYKCLKIVLALKDTELIFR